MEINVVEKAIVPEVPRVLAGEQLFVYVPTADMDNKGVASYSSKYFTVIDGRVYINQNFIDELTAKNSLSLKEILTVDVNVEKETKLYVKQEKFNREARLGDICVGYCFNGKFIIFVSEVVNTSEYITLNVTNAVTIDITIDDTLSVTSSNAVKNKVISSAIMELITKLGTDDLYSDDLIVNWAYDNADSNDYYEFIVLDGLYDEPSYIEGTIDIQYVLDGETVNKTIEINSPYFDDIAKVIELDDNHSIYLKARYIKNTPENIGHSFLYFSFEPFSGAADIIYSTVKVNYYNFNVTIRKQLSIIDYIKTNGLTEEKVNEIVNDVVNDRFNGANKAVSFFNYSSMIISLNTLGNNSYNVGQNVMIVTLNVPDLWVSEIAEESIDYTYVSDDDFVNELNTNGSVQVGYYKLSALETQKVDLSDYVKNTDVATNTKAGLVSYNSAYGMQIIGSALAPLAWDSYITKRNNAFMSYAVLDKAVKAGLTTNKETLTDEEKAKAQEWLGIVAGGLTEEELVEKGFVKNTDYASDAQYGLVKTHYNKWSSGLEFKDNMLLIYPAAKGDINVKSESSVLPITPQNLDYAVKVGLTTNKETLTAEEKAKARRWLGAVGSEDIDAIYNILNQTVIGTEEITEAYNTRTTANGLSGLIDGSYARIEKVQGNSFITFNGTHEYSQVQYFESHAPYDEEGNSAGSDYISLDSQVNLAEFDYIDFNEKKVVKQTSGVLTLTGDENWMILSEGSPSRRHIKTRFRVEKLVSAFTNAQSLSIMSNNYTPTTAENTYYGGSSGVPTQGIAVNAGYLFIYDDNFAIGLDSAENTEEKRAELLANFKAHLKELYNAGTPVTLVYKLATATEETINIPKNKYKVWVDGQEMLSGMGTVPTVTTTYVVKRGGNA